MTKDNHLDAELDDAFEALEAEKPVSEVPTLDPEGTDQSIDDLIAELEKELPRDTKRNTKRSKKDLAEWNKGTGYAQVWYPEAVTLRVKIQYCSSCEAEHEHVEGLFLRSITKNGALKWNALGKEEMKQYNNLPKDSTITEEDVPFCPACWGQAHPTSLEWEDEEESNG